MQFLVNIDVDDLGKAVQFYRAAFGLQTGRRLGDAGIEMLGGAAPIHLLHKQAGTRATTATDEQRRYTRHWSPLHLDVVVDDIEAAVQGAVAAGAIVEEAISSHAWGKLALMADPFGHGFCFVQLSERGYDAIGN
ncbi:MAG TPA: VOC family protein [Oxalicibacterium sp.]|jgi:predicted enzyme related to lactoylglutathione lyase|nr:VOC family protein [Oxalicibacterium sp.]